MYSYAPTSTLSLTIQQNIYNTILFNSSSLLLKSCYRAIFINASIEKIIIDFSLKGYVNMHRMKPAATSERTWRKLLSSICGQHVPISSFRAFLYIVRDLSRAVRGVLFGNHGLSDCYPFIYIYGYGLSEP